MRFIVAALCLLALPVQAEVKLRSAGLETTLHGALRYQDGSDGLFRLSVVPKAKLTLGSNWQADIRLRLEGAAGETGLGSLGTFSPASRPFIDDETLQGDVERAVLAYRRRATQITLGKQTVAWGVLDGLRITDRFDAVRLREFIFTDVRPERLARWGVRARAKLGEWQIDAAAHIDPSVNQLALSGDAFDVKAPRLRAGLPPGAAVPQLVVSDRGNALEDGTFGLRAGRRIGQSDLSVLVLTGPDTEPLFQLAEIGNAVRLDYAKRTLIGATFQQQAGPVVWRLEGAFIPDQQVNTITPTPLSQTQRSRVLLGGAVDWRGSGGLFINAQLGWDHLSGGPEQLVRPRDDVISTLRIQRPFLQETLLARVEVITSLSDGDGVVRPAVDYQVSDQLSISAGSDVIFGTRSGLFGQFRDESRLWVRLTHAL